jgi:phosphate transport system permease protein
MIRPLFHRLLWWACAAASWFCLAGILLLLVALVWYGIHMLSWGFFTQSSSSPDPRTSGMYVALMGSLWLVGLTTILAVPIGVGAAVYLVEFSRRGRWHDLMQANIASLAGVPSIIYGLLGLGVFVRTLALGHSVLAGALTLTLIVMPVLIIAAQEALRSVPPAVRQTSLALGATRWQTVWRQVLPAAFPGIMTGIILALGRALGEAAPLLVIGAAAFASFAPSSLLDDFSALPVQVYSWTSHAQKEFQALAAGGVLVLLALLLALNMAAVVLRRVASGKGRVARDEWRVGESL